MDANQLVPTEPEEEVLLTDRQKMWIIYYVGEANCDAQKAALLAGYEASTARQAQRWTKKPAIREAIDRILYHKAMGAGEIVMRMSQHARANLKDIVDENGRLPDNLKNLTAEQTAVIKEMSVRVNKDGSKNVSIKLHDAQTALKELGKRFDLFPDSLNLNIPTSELDAAISNGLALLAGQSQNGLHSGVGEEVGDPIIEAVYSVVGGDESAPDVFGVRAEDE